MVHIFLNMLSIFILPQINKKKNCVFNKPKLTNIELIELKVLNKNIKQEISQINESDSSNRVENKTVE